MSENENYDSNVALPQEEPVTALTKSNYKLLNRLKRRQPVFDAL